MYQVAYLLVPEVGNRPAHDPAEDILTDSRNDLCTYPREEIIGCSLGCYPEQIDDHQDDQQVVQEADIFIRDDVVDNDLQKIGRCKGSQTCNNDQEEKEQLVPEILFEVRSKFGGGFPVYHTTFVFMGNLSIGIDIAEVETIKKMMETSGPAFCARTFTPGEIDACEKRKSARYQCFSARFAVKEAFMKALGTGWNKKLQWTHIEIINEPSGQPCIRLYKVAKQLFSEKGFTSISVSISHTRHIAVACVILQ
jgi:holo-[acyl-carrier protein] synthase